jgi:hypothetical protein
MITIYCGSVKTSSRPVLLEKATEQVCSAAYPCRHETSLAAATDTTTISVLVYIV